MRTVVAFFTALVMSTFSPLVQAEDIAVKALDCQFSIPADYVVSRSPQGEMIFDGGIGREIRIQAMESKMERVLGIYDLLKSEKIKHMTIEYYDFPRFDDSTIYDLVIVRALGEMGRFTRVPKKLVKSVIKQCTRSVTETVIKAKERDRAECDLKVNFFQDSFALLKPARPEPVFQNGKARSLRFYNVPATGLHKSIDLQDADELMSMCGISAAVGMAASKRLCCDTRDDGSIELIFKRKGKKFSALLSGDSLKYKE